jgi:predicted Zn-dependent peptidase
VGVARHNPDHFRLVVADYILGGGGASRLFGQIRSRLGLAYAVGSFILEPEGPGVIGLGAQTKAASTVQIVQAIRAELEKFNSAEPSAEELKLAKDAIGNSFIFNFDSPAAIASQKADLEFYGYPKNYLDTYLHNIRAVRGADVLKTAKTYYVPGQMKILVVGDQSKFGGPLNQAGEVVTIPLESIR